MCGYCARTKNADCVYSPTTRAASRVNGEHIKSGAAWLDRLHPVLDSDATKHDCLYTSGACPGECPFPAKLNIFDEMQLSLGHDEDLHFHIASTEIHDSDFFANLLGGNSVDGGKYKGVDSAYDDGTADPISLSTSTATSEDWITLEALPSCATKLERRIPRFAAFANEIARGASDASDGRTCLRDDDFLGVDQVSPVAQGLVFHPGILSKYQHYIDISLGEIGGNAQCTPKARLYELLSSLVQGHTSNATNAILVAGVVANGWLEAALENEAITRGDLVGPFTLFQSACSWIRSAWRTDQDIVAIQGFLSLLIFAQKCASHMVLYLFAQLKGVLDRIGVDDFSWTDYQAMTVESDHMSLHHAFWTMLFRDTAVKLFFGMRPAFVSHVQDEVASPLAGLSDQTTSALWLRAMASLYPLCQEASKVLRSNEMRMETATRAQLLARAANWKNELPPLFRDLDCPLPAYLEHSQAVRRAGVRLSSLYYELCLTFHCTGIEGEGAPGSPVTDSQMVLLGKLFHWASGLAAGDLISDCRLVGLLLDGCAVAGALACTRPSRDLLALLGNAQKAISSISYLLHEPADATLAAVEAARRQCALGVAASESIAAVVDS
ncbi:hypothetical protein AC578_9905 [Pseudocercospora eumusae]|uniref:Transcription factor domain-containing protein n=1 Tax=Pseudocercospora eumusae TaxID=321146 RepID=A0A139HBF6_9PEZI|nr:hypothetical protein AC578_9905 [Pseudocercospora eumusae]KXS99698.1 hypothetical protein AC578_9905 [Pseudocercospora eumusae]KXS99699.1 hypothetical protein AC578_9905 [Pseudocercospora eumusae]